MIHCKFEDGGDARLRHTVANVLVVRDNKILLVKRAKRLLEGGKWSLPGGFMDRDESISQTALRELKEETGWIGQLTGLFCIVSYPFRINESRQNVAFCYLVKPLENTDNGDDESDDMEWFELDSLNTNTVAFDHGRIIKKYREYLEHTISLPILIEDKDDY